MVSASIRKGLAFAVPVSAAVFIANIWVVVASPWNTPQRAAANGIVIFSQAWGGLRRVGRIGQSGHVGAGVHGRLQKFVELGQRDILLDPLHDDGVVETERDASVGELISHIRRARPPGI